MFFSYRICHHWNYWIFHILFIISFYDQAKKFLLSFKGIILEWDWIWELVIDMADHNFGEVSKSPRPLNTALQVRWYLHGETAWHWGAGRSQGNRSSRAPAPRHTLLRSKCRGNWELNQTAPSTNYFSFKHLRCPAGPGPFLTPGHTIEKGSSFANLSVDQFLIWFDCWRPHHKWVLGSGEHQE